MIKPFIVSNKKSTVYDCTVVNLPKIVRAEGSITAVNNGFEIPFDVERVYYLYDVPGGESRGGHGHEKLQQVIVAASGSFSVTVDDGKVSRTFSLSRPDCGLYMPAGIWRTLDSFSSGSICLVLASSIYDEKDYFRDYEQFLKFRSA